MPWGTAIVVVLPQTVVTVIAPIADNSIARIRSGRSATPYSFE